MSRTKRNSNTREVSRSVNPYKRKKMKLNDFELDYIASNNRTARIEL